MDIQTTFIQNDWDKLRASMYTAGVVPWLRVVAESESKSSLFSVSSGGRCLFLIPKKTLPMVALGEVVSVHLCPYSTTRMNSVSPSGCYNDEQGERKRRYKVEVKGKINAQTSEYLNLRLLDDWHQIAFQIWCDPGGLFVLLPSLWFWFVTFSGDNPSL